jgi:hypothetical protein
MSHILFTSGSATAIVVAATAFSRKPMKATFSVKKMSEFVADMVLAEEIPVRFCECGRARAQRGMGVQRAAGGLGESLLRGRRGCVRGGAAGAE